MTHTQFFITNIYSIENIYWLATKLEPKSCKLFLVMLATANEEGYINTSLSDLSNKTGMSILTIRKAIKQLKTLKVLEVNYIVGVSSNYRLLELKS